MGEYPPHEIGRPEAHPRPASAAGQVFQFPLAAPVFCHLSRQRRSQAALGFTIDAQDVGFKAVELYQTAPGFSLAPGLWSRITRARATACWAARHPGPLAAGSHRPTSYRHSFDALRCRSGLASTTQPSLAHDSVLVVTRFGLTVALLLIEVIATHA